MQDLAHFAMKRFCVQALVIFSLATGFLAGEETGFIRVDEDERAIRLQTAVTRFEKGGVKVDLIGAIHIADRAYYLDLNKRFESYETLLFEMIGGERLQDSAPVQADPERKELQALRRLYQVAMRTLALTGQIDVIDYTAKNFVHADLTLAEFERMQAERGESLLGFAAAAGQAEPESARQPNPAKVLLALAMGNPNLLKREIVHTLGTGDDQIAAYVGESVIITHRNIRCLEVMDREIAAGRKNLAIFYGAAHLPDMEKRLIEAGFRQTGEDWVTAWNLPKPKHKSAIGR
jgi:hypothetical protein